MDWPVDTSHTLTSLISSPSSGFALRDIPGGDHLDPAEASSEPSEEKDKPFRSLLSSCAEIVASCALRATSHSLILP